MVARRHLFVAAAMVVCLGGLPASIPAQEEVAVTPKAASVSKLANTSGLTATFSVQNTGFNTDLIQMYCSASAPVACTSVSPSSATMYPNQIISVTVTYSVGTPAPGQLSLIAINEASGYGDGGWYVISVLAPYQVAVTPGGLTTVGTAPFTIQNVGYNSDTYTLSCSATGAVTCTGTSASSVTLASLASQSVTASYTIGAGSGTLTLTAASAGASARGWYSLPISSVAITTYHYDNLRTGWNEQEQALSQINVASASFGLRHSLTLDDQVDAQPLVVPNVRLADGTQHEVVYVATENNSIYGFDAGTGAILLFQNFGPPVPKGQLPGQCGNNGPNMGINSTPVLDVASNRMYVITYTFSNSVPAYKLHALSLSTLTDTVPSVSITASHRLADGSTFSFSATYQRQRPGLLEANGNIYAGFGSFCDFGGYNSRGWLLGWSASSLTPLAANQLNDTQDNLPFQPLELSSIWMSGYGVAADATGNVHFITGNTTSGHHNSVTDISESVVKLSPDLTTVQGVFSPSDFNSLDQNDTDFGSGGVMLLPDQPGSVPHLAVAAGKENPGMYLLNRDGLSNKVAGPYGIGACWCGPSYFVGADSVGRVVASGGSNVSVWKVQTSPSVTLISETSSPTLTTGQDGGFLTTVSSSGSQPGTAIVWAVSRPTNANPANISLVAFKASAVWGPGGATLFSATAGTWPNTGGNANIVPVVANGRVYVASYRQLAIFGLQ